MAAAELPRSKKTRGSQPRIPSASATAVPQRLASHAWEVPLAEEEEAAFSSSQLS